MKTVKESLQVNLEPWQTAMISNGNKEFGDIGYNSVTEEIIKEKIKNL